MTDFDTIKNILDKVYPQEASRPYLDYVLEGKIILEFPQGDEYYNTCFIFDENGKLERVDQSLIYVRTILYTAFMLDKL